MVNSLNMASDQAATLHQQYLREFGSTIEGLIHCHQVDPMVFNKQVDDALPLEDLLEELLYRYQDLNPVRSFIFEHIELVDRPLFQVCARTFILNNPHPLS